MINELKSSKFETLEEFINYLKDASERNVTYGKWTGASSYENALKIAREGVELGRATSQVHKLEHSRQEMVMVSDVCGSVVNMDAYLSGEPENMVEFPVTVEPTKFINILFDIGELSHVPVEHMVNKAIAIASVVDDLENSGYRVAVSAVNISRFDKTFTGRHISDHSTVLATRIKVKNYHEALSIGQLTGVSHPSFFRSLIFKHFNKAFKNGGDAPSDMGTCLTNKEDIARAVSSFAEAEGIYVPSSFSAKVGGISSVESAVEMVTHYIKSSL